MNQLGNAALALGFICQVVDQDFYPLGDVFSVRIWPEQFIEEAVSKIKSSKCKMIRDLGIIDDLASIDDVPAALWKLSTPYPLDDNNENVGEVLQEIRGHPQSFAKMLKATSDFSRYFEGKQPPDHLHALLQLSISGVDGGNPF